MRATGSVFDFVSKVLSFVDHVSFVGPVSVLLVGANCQSDCFNLSV